MSPQHRLSQSVPTAEEIDFLESRLYEHNVDRTGVDDGQLFAFYVRDEQDAILAGIEGWVWAGACEVERLWVHPAWRGQGYGQQLVRSAETLAAENGCQVILIDSFSFQAPGFYQKLGYELAWTLADFPPGHSRAYLVKRLAR